MSLMPHRPHPTLNAMPPLAAVPRITVVMPIRNEAAFIERAVGAVLNQDYPPDLVEVLVIDGMSDDGTRKVVRSTIESHPERKIRLIDNPDGIVPPGLNRALAAATGEVVVRIDGHCIIQSGYLTRCVEGLHETGAVCVGGQMETVGSSWVARAISLAQSSPFGVGGVAFRIGGDYGRSVDTLAFGAYRKEAFDLLGGFDEELVRNQDDEFNFRLTQAGGVIWLDPKIRSVYFSRASLRKLWRQYYQYGFYKVRVMQKRGGVASWRHLVPGAFVGALFLSAFASIATGQPEWFGLVAGSYAAGNLVASFWTAKRSWTELPLLPITFAILHVSYGLGFWHGLWSWRARWNDKTTYATPGPFSTTTSTST